jgi:hypothetical protein
MDQKFLDDDEKPENLDFETWPMAHGHNPAKVSKLEDKAWWYAIARKFHADEK